MLKFKEIFLPKGHHATRMALVLLSMLCIFSIDMVIPLGIAVASLYCVPILLSKNSHRKRIIFYGTMAVALTAIKFAFWYEGPGDLPSLANRVVVLIAIITATLLILKIKAVEEQKEEQEKEHMKRIEQMMLITSQQVRGPVSNCLGIVEKIKGKHDLSAEEMKHVIDHIERSAQDLDRFTIELTAFIYESGIVERIAPSLGVYDIKDNKQPA
jgi:hypothetical protein